MDECQALVLSLFTERFTWRRPRSSNGDPVEHFGRPPARTQSLSNSVTASVRAPASPLARRTQERKETDDQRQSSDTRVRALVKAPPSTQTVSITSTGRLPSRVTCTGTLQRGRRQ
jgi:hypothetical protein